MASQQVINTSNNILLAKNNEKQSSNELNAYVNWVTQDYFLVE